MWSGRVLPGVHVLGIPLSGYTVEEATAALDQQWGAQPIYAHDGNQSVLTNPTALGLLLDAEATAQAAVRIGRFSALPETLLTLQALGQVNPVWYFDPAAAEAELHTLADSFDVAPTNAGVQFANGQLAVTPSRPGSQLDTAASAAWLQQNAGQVVRTQQLPLVTTAVTPTVTDDQAQALVDQTNARLVTDLTLPLFDPISNETITWSLTPEVWVNWLALQNDGTNLAWDVNAEPVAAYVDAQALDDDVRYLDTDQAVGAIRSAVTSTLNGAAANPAALRIYHRDQQHVVQSGETFSSIAYAYGMPYPWLQQANPGLDALSVGQSITIPSHDAFLPLPIVRNKRIIIDISAQRMWAYENDALKWEWGISTGISSSPTSPGVFQIQTHEENAYAGNWDLWMPNFMGIYRPVPTSDFMNGFHGFPTRNGANLLWTNSIGTPVTYGCVLVSNDNMAQLYSWGEEGVVVEIRP